MRKCIWIIVFWPTTFSLGARPNAMVGGGLGFLLPVGILSDYTGPGGGIDGDFSYIAHKRYGEVGTKWRFFLLSNDAITKSFRSFRLNLYYSAPILSYYFTKQAFVQPYLGLGYGWYFISTKAAKDTSRNFHFSLGGRFSYQADKKLWLATELLYNGIKDQTLLSLIEVRFVAFYPIKL